MNFAESLIDYLTNHPNFKNQYCSSEEEEDIKDVIFKKGLSRNRCIKGEKQFKYAKDIILKPRLHLCHNYPKDARKSYARPDGFFVKNDKIASLIEVKILHKNNDYEIFNGVVQLREYMKLYDVSNGVLLIISRLTKYYKEAVEFLYSLCKEENLCSGKVQVVIANFCDNKWKIENIETLLKDGTGFLVDTKDCCWCQAENNERHDVRD